MDAVKRLKQLVGTGSIESWLEHIIIELDDDIISQMKKVAFAWQHYVEDMLSGDSRRKIKVSDDNPILGSLKFDDWYKNVFSNTNLLEPLEKIKKEFEYTEYIKSISNEEIIDEITKLNTISSEDVSIEFLKFMLDTCKNEVLVRMNN